MDTNLKDIIIGAACVVYCGDSRGDKWALPGRKFTESQAVAERVCGQMADMMREQGCAPIVEGA